MKLIATITDKDIGEEELSINKPSARNAVRAILFNDNNEIALLNKQIKNEFKLIGGGVEKGESFEKALRREALEETGCEIKVISKMGYVIEFRTKNNFIQKSHIYICKVSSNSQELSLTKQELDEQAQLLWFKPSIALKKISESYQKLIPSKYSNLYSSKMVIKRDETILKYYINNYQQDKKEPQ